MTFFEWFSQLFQNLGQTLSRLGEFLFDIAASFVYLLQAAGQLVGSLAQILWQLANLLLSFGQGLINTMQTVSAPEAWSRGGFETGWNAVANVLPLDTLGWILAGIIWVVSATAILRLIREGAK